MVHSRRGLSEVFGAIIAVVVAIGIASTLFLVGGKVSWAIGEAGVQARDSIVQAGSPIISEARVSGGSLLVSFYSPAAPITRVMALGPGGEVLGNSVLEEPAVSGDLVLVEGYDCTPVIIAFATEAGAVKFSSNPFQCSQADAGAGGAVSAWIPLGGVWAGLIDLGVLDVVEVGGSTQLGVEITLDIVVNNSCTVYFRGLGSESRVDGSPGYAEELLGSVGGLWVYAFAACLDDGLWAGVRLDSGGGVIAGRAVVDGSVYQRWRPGSTGGLNAAVALVYSDGLEALQGESRLSEARGLGVVRWFGLTSASGSFTTATGVIALFHTPRPLSTEAQIAASISVESVLDISFIPAEAQLPLEPPMELALLDYRDSSPGHGIDTLLAPQPRIVVSYATPLGPVERVLEPQGSIRISTPGASPPTLRIELPHSMGTPLKPSTALVEAGNEYVVTLQPSRSPAGEPLKPLLTLARKPGEQQATIIAAAGLGAQPIALGPAEDLAESAAEYYEASINLSLRTVFLSQEPTAPQPQKAYLETSTTLQPGPKAVTLKILD